MARHGGAGRARSGKAAARHRRRATNCAKGAAGESRVCRVLSSLALQGYHHLDDRRVLEGRSANIDHVVVGPRGVFVVDAKNWTGRVEVREDHLVQNGVRRDESLIALTWIAGRVDEFLTLSSAPLLSAQCVVSLSPGSSRGGTVGRVLVTTDDRLRETITAGERVLSSEQIEEIVELLAGAFAPYDVEPRDVAAAEEFLFPELETRHAGLREALARPIADWMIWLHLEQAQLARASHSWSGPHPRIGWDWQDRRGPAPTRPPGSHPTWTAAVADLRPHAQRRLPNALRATGANSR